MFKENSTENKEDINYVPFHDAMRNLGQAQYTSWFVNPSPKLHDEGTPYFSEIRIQGNPDDYYDFKIHKDDIRKFIEQWFAYKKETNPMFTGRKLEDYL